MMFTDIKLTDITCMPHLIIMLLFLKLSTYTMCTYYLTYHTQFVQHTLCTVSELFYLGSELTCFLSLPLLHQTAEGYWGCTECPELLQCDNQYPGSPEQLPGQRGTRNPGLPGQSPVQWQRKRTGRHKSIWCQKIDTTKTYRYAQVLCLNHQMSENLTQRKRTGMNNLVLQCFFESWHSNLITDSFFIAKYFVWSYFVKISTITVTCTRQSRFRKALQKYSL